MNSKQKMNEMIYRIKHAEQYENILKERFPEYPLCEYKIYNRNLAMRVLFNNIKTGKGTGNCSVETTQYYMERFSPMSNETIKENSMLCRGYILGALKEIIYHYFIIFVSESKKYYITHSNGIHKIIPYYKTIDNIFNIQVAHFQHIDERIKLIWGDCSINKKGTIEPCCMKNVAKKRVGVRNRLRRKILQREEQN